MKDAFFGYYPPTSEQYETLWTKGIIVPDTNVLLDLYRLPPQARDELMAVLAEVSERLWVPYQVAVEFQRQRLTVISSERKATEDVLEAAKNLVGALKSKVEALQIDKHGLDLDPGPLVRDLEQANAKLIEAVTAVHKTQPDVAASDAIRDRLDEILKGKIGPGPSNQAELDALTDGGEQRYSDRIPPGYADAEKDKNPNQAIFFHDHLRYQRKFGDLILWRQLLSHVKATNIKSVLIVTADRKEDWWWREQGKTIGVQPELVREIRRVGEVELFWMYSSVQFLEHAKKYANTEISDQAVAQLQEVSATPRRTFSWLNVPSAVSADRIIRGTSLRLAPRPDYREMERSVYNWLSEIHGEVIENEGFPDFIIAREDDLHGFEVKFTPTFQQMVFTPSVVNSMLRGYLEVNEERLATFTMIVVIPLEDAQAIRSSNRLGELRHRLAQLLARYPIHAIAVGAVEPAGEFEPLIQVGSSDLRTPGFDQ